jgi:hypothetical protein
MSRSSKAEGSRGGAVGDRARDFHPPPAAPAPAKPVKLTETQDDLIAVRASLRQMIRDTTDQMQTT